MVKKTNKKISLGILISIILVSLAVLVIALSIQNAEINVRSPVNGGNLSGNYLSLFNVSFSNSTLNATGNGAVTNATFYLNYSASVWSILGNSTHCVLPTTETNSYCSGSLNGSQWSNGSVIKEGYYSVNASLWNGSGTDLLKQGTGMANLTTILVDTTEPSTVSINSVPSGQNHSVKSNSGNLTLNVTADDALANISIVHFLILNATGKVNATITGIKEGNSPRYSASINTSHIPNGYVNITLFVNDTAGNYNVTANSSTAPLIRDLIFDNTLPSVSFSCTPTSLTSGDTVTCTCSGSATSGVNSTSYTASPSTSSTGTYTQTCEVISKSGISNSATSSYTIELAGSGSSSGSGGSTTTTIVPSIAGSVAVSETKLSSDSGYRAKFSNNAQIESSFTASGGSKEKHSVKVTNITSDKVMISVSSDPISLELSAGETKKVDVDSDKIYDLSLTLNGIVTGKADLSVKQISEAAPSDQEGPVSAGEIPGVTDAVDEETTSKSNTYLWIILAVVLVIVIAGIVYYIRNKKKK